MYYSSTQRFNHKENQMTNATASFDDMTTVTMKNGNKALAEAAQAKQEKLPHTTNLKGREVIGKHWSGDPIFKPQVGDACTKYIGSDRYAGTIVAVSKSGKRVTWRQDETIPAEGHEGPFGRQRYDYLPVENGYTMEFSLRKSGSWRVVGESDRNGYGLRMGERDTYRDPHF